MSDRDWTVKTELVLTRGYPASGKTTWARAWVADGENRARVNRDDLRLMITQRYWPLSPVEEANVTVAQVAAVRGLLVAGTDVVVDDTNLRPGDAELLIGYAIEVGSSWRVVDFETDADECIRRDADRAEIGDRNVGSDVIRLFASKYPLPWTVFGTVG